MNCLEFRRQLAIDPQCAEVDFVQHRQECARCAEACAQANAFEDSLRQTLAITVPPQLAESILLAHATRQQRQRQYFRRGAILALAAAVVLAFGIGMRVEASPLATQAVAHLRDEAEVLTWTKLVPPASVREAFATRGIALHSIPDGISFVGCCPMGHHLTVHLVMPGSGGPVTVIYVVGDREGAREDFRRDGWHGRSVPMGQGTLILLAQDASHFDQVENIWRVALVRRFRQSITARISTGVILTSNL
jgi:hypothetical protein